MASVDVDLAQVQEFADPQAFYAWLAVHHDQREDVWVKIHKLRSGLASITPEQAIEMALCWGWIDGLRKGFDERSFLQRYSRRRPTSNWSQINARSVHRLTQAGVMRESGLAAAARGVQKGKWPADIDPPAPVQS